MPRLVLRKKGIEGGEKVVVGQGAHAGRGIGKHVEVARYIIGSRDVAVVALMKREMP